MFIDITSIDLFDQNMGMTCGEVRLFDQHVGMVCDGYGV